jgi:lipopolysaccharide/colanic/teichoic acid biosynthesis glycosyltransferase
MPEETQPIDVPLLKRATDFVVALLLLVFFGPLLLLLMLAILVSMLCRKSDRGRLLYRERRISRGREFDILKFRVLTNAALRLMEEEGKHARMLEDDIENLTWAGRVLVKPCYLDEFPQLLNILLGQMSLVGPRPWPVSMVEDQVASGADYRMRVTAGWTGPAQLEKRVGGNMTGGQSQKLDVEYVENLQTLGGVSVCVSDMKVLLKTAQVMLQRQGLKN